MKTIRIRVFLTLFLLSSSLINAQNSSWIWAESFGGTKSDAIRIIDTDDDGNICFAGLFDSNTLELGEFILQNKGLRDGFVAKCNETGEVIWATCIGGTQDDLILGICSDGEGNTYVTGHFESYYFTIGDITITNNGSWDCFFAKFDPSGNVLWARGFGGPGEDILYAIGVNSYGDIWVSGHFDNPSLSLDDITLFNPYPGYDEVMLVKANNDGDIIFGTTAKGNNDDRCYRLAIDDDDNVVISGGFGSSSISFSSHILSNFGSYDVFLAKYDNNGNIQWAKGAEGFDADYGYAVTTDSEGFIYATGYFLSPYIYFDEYYINNNGGFDAYIVKYSPGGDVMWIDGIGGIYEDRGYGLCTLNDNKLFVTGTFKSPSLQVGTLTLSNNGDFDCFFIELDLEGNVIFAENIGGPYKEGAQAITTSNGDRVLLGGYFTSSSINVGDYTLTNSNQGYSDSYIAEYGVIGLVPIADFDYENFDLTVNFYNASQNATSFLWDFGDGIGSDIENPVHTYNEYGDYVVTLIAFNGDDSDTISKTVHLCELPFSSFDFEIEDYQITFLNLSLNALSYFWYFDDGNFAYLENPVYTYTEEGEYNVYLIASNDCGSDTSFATVQICISPTAGFDFLQNGFEISFLNNSIKFDSCSWDFGDGFGSINTNPVHTYSNEGEYNVILTVYNTCGEDSYNTEISINLSPVADFDYEINEFSVHFQNLSVNADSFIWDFGDGETSAENNPVHSYDDIGEYTVSLIAFNEYGNDTSFATIQICVSPTASFDFLQNGFEISFLNNSTTFDSCSWDFGDGDGSINTNPVHTYSNEGEYNVILTVYNTCGEDSCNAEISIYLLPVADFDFEISEFLVHFQNLSLNADSFLWDFGDGTTSEENDPVHSYDDIGQYTVTLIAFNEYSDDTLVQVLDVTDIPEFSNQHSITIYPNPAKGSFTLQTVAPGVKNIDLQLFTIEGKLVFRKEFVNASKSNVVEIYNIPEGLYLLKITILPGQVSYKKIIIY